LASFYARVNLLKKQTQNPVDISGQSLVSAPNYRNNHGASKTENNKDKYDKNNTG